MHCWEFHHAVRGKKIEWHWKAINADGSLHGESGRRFKSSVEAFEDARVHGFDKELHEWYMAPAGTRPCVKDKRSA